MTWTHTVLDWIRTVPSQQSCVWSKQARFHHLRCSQAPVVPGVSGFCTASLISVLQCAPTPTRHAYSHDGRRCRTPCTLCVQPSGLIQQQSTVQRSHGFQGRSIQRMAGVSHTQSTSITRGSHTATISQRLSSGFFHTWHHSRPSRRLHGSSPRTRSVHALPSRDGTEGGTD